MASHTALESDTTNLALSAQDGFAVASKLSRDTDCYSTSKHQGVIDACAPKSHLLFNLPTSSVSATVRNAEAKVSLVAACLATPSH